MLKPEVTNPKFLDNVKVQPILVWQGGLGDHTNMVYRLINTSSYGDSIQSFVVEKQSQDAMGEIRWNHIDLFSHEGKAVLNVVLTEYMKGTRQL